MRRDVFLKTGGKKVVMELSSLEKKPDVIGLLMTNGTRCGERTQEHTDLRFTYGGQISVYKGLTSVPVFSSKPKEEIKVITEELSACLKRVKDKLLKNPNIHIGWYAKSVSLEFIYKDRIYKITPMTLDFDEIDFSEATDWKKESYKGGAVGNADAYFEQNERIIRATLNEELGVVFLHGHGNID